MLWVQLTSNLGVGAASIADARRTECRKIRGAIGALCVLLGGVENVELTGFVGSDTQLDGFSKKAVWSKVLEVFVLFVV